MSPSAVLSYVINDMCKTSITTTYTVIDLYTCLVYIHVHMCSNEHVYL